jgi:hypothetical protein
MTVKPIRPKAFWFECCKGKHLKASRQIQSTGKTRNQLYEFLSDVPSGIQAVIEAKKDS